LEVKKAEGRKDFLCHLYYCRLLFNGANVIHIFDCAKKTGEKITNWLTGEIPFLSEVSFLAKYKFAKIDKIYCLFRLLFIF
jgi:hypothetical protein